MLSNFKLLCFISLNKIDEFYKNIKEKYNKMFQEFFKYFENFYFKKKPFNSKWWNYNKIIKEEIDIEKKLFTNNIVESCNRTLNLHYLGGTKTFYILKKLFLKFWRYIKINQIISHQKYQ